MVTINRLGDIPMTQPEGSQSESQSDVSELPRAEAALLANTAATTVSHAASTITTSFKEDNATDPNNRLSAFKELVASQPTVLRKPIESHLLRVIHRNDSKLKKMQGIAKLAEKDFTPKSLIVKMKLSVNNQLTNDPSTCKRLENWNAKKVQFQTDLKTILREQAQADLDQMVRSHIEEILNDLVGFATQWSLFTREKEMPMYQRLQEQDERYAIAAVQQFLYNEGITNKYFFTDVLGASQQKVRRFYQSAHYHGPEDEDFYGRWVQKEQITTDTWNDANDSIKLERELIQEVAAWLSDVFGQMHSKSHREMEKWRNLQNANAALIDTTKKVAQLDLCSHIEKNINRDSNQTIAESVRKLVAEELNNNNNNNNNNKYSSPRKISRNRNKPNKASNEKAEKAKKPANPKSTSKSKTRKRKTRAAKKAEGSDETVDTTSDPNPVQNVPKRQHFSTIQEGNQTMLQIANPYYQQHVGSPMAYGAPPYNYPLPPPPRYPPYQPQMQSPPWTPQFRSRGRGRGGRGRGRGRGNYGSPAGYSNESYDGLPPGFQR